jgi:hypothetical protein
MTALPCSKQRVNSLGTQWFHPANGKALLYALISAFQAKSFHFDGFLASFSLTQGAGRL